MTVRVGRPSAVMNLNDAAITETLRTLYFHHSYQNQSLERHVKFVRHIQR